MPNGLSSAPTCFIKLMKPVYSTLRQKSHLNVGYIDDSYLQGRDTNECLPNISDTQKLFSSLGFVINVQKSSVTPAQRIISLGFVFDFVSMTITLTDDKKAKVKANCTAMQHKHETTITELVQLVGTIVSSLPGVQFGKLHYRNLEIEKNLALREQELGFRVKAPKKQYITYIKKWQKFCAQRQINHTQPSVVPVLDFLTALYQQGLTYNAINTARSALSSYVTLEDGTCVGKHPLVFRLMKGIFQEKPPRPKNTEIWNVSLVLEYLQSSSPVDKLSLKELTLKLVVIILLVSGQRGQTVHMLNIDCMFFSSNCYTFQLVGHLKQSRPGVNNPLVKLTAFEDKTLCVVSTLKEYLTRRQLFVSYQKPFRKVGRETISWWMKTVLTDSGIDTSRFKSHSTWAASTSAANNASDVFPDKATERKILSFSIKCPSEDCEWTGELREKEDHFDQCSQFPVTCPNNCGCSVPRGLVRRGEVDSHLQDFMKIHLDLACVKLRITEDKLEKTQDTLNDTKRTTKNLVEKVETLQNRLEAKTFSTVMAKSESALYRLKFVWKVSNFSDIMRQAKAEVQRTFESDPFYTENYGYRLKLRIHPNGARTGLNSHLSVFLIIMKGEYDALLPWPFKRKVRFTLIDQQEDPEQRNKVSTMRSNTKSRENYERPTNREENVGRGLNRFISHEELYSRRYVENDILFLQFEIGPVVSRAKKYTLLSESDESDGQTL
ncbi:TNF receptor-associated factor 4 [Stylophora pistillata]|uniref:TNF receptor-associated factor 4 n=1 Tax=Stylophora pistillata TaxID=50429 RepID=A0A2B4RGA3_STYPI|nr:TNF receptor-associated factor 4 [Stylophora pistillata]